MAERYELDCTDCSFHTTVSGEFADVFGDIEAHREERNAGPHDHFVNVHHRDRPSTDSDSQ